MQYLLRLIRNPYQWGSGDTFIVAEDKEALDRLLADYSNIQLPNLEDKNLWSKGYPGYAYIEKKVYEIKEVTDEVLHK